ncbi:hypothetical protein KM176_16360 [Pseudooceanicola sp. CBS1P-1]|uniref:Uncharacterized protein n=1 Tax=Pseudooceanicola albus TaxID=2692189 RepID=A0A6L7G7P2_9RHOB|nr:MULTISPECIES: hypothetical protein [Pseudooceanicola]MBT9385448.1 hypothetical protein [Pseudooceanicola endophyticus]MXN18693.1 hypothetical protein [Pseudooceanicola albus]
MAGEARLQEIDIGVTLPPMSFAAVNEPAAAPPIYALTCALAADAARSYARRIGSGVHVPATLDFPMNRAKAGPWPDRSGAGRGPGMPRRSHALEARQVWRDSDGAASQQLLPKDHGTAMCQRVSWTSLLLPEVRKSAAAPLLLPGVAALLPPLDFRCFATPSKGVFGM